MKPLFTDVNLPSIKPSVLGLVCGADHEISTNDGTIYILKEDRTCCLFSI